MRVRWRIVLVGMFGLLVLAGCGGGVGAPQANPPAVVVAAPTETGGTASWGTTQRTHADLTYSYRYPAGWSADLAYCAPGAARTAGSNELPARCASTDILVGQKAKDVGTLRGGNLTNLVIDGKQAARQLDDNPRNGMASRIYTVMLYDGTGVPLVGFSTSIGPGTDDATKNNITATLDKIATTLTVGR
jgi:hypothetical protein